MHQVIKDDAFRGQLEKAAGRAFLFFGGEDYLKAAAVRTARETLCPDPAMAFFNDVTIDATDYTPDKLLDAMAAPPMMTDARLILLRGFDFNTIKPSELDTLTEVLAQLEEYDYNCIIIYVAAGLIDVGRIPQKPSAIFKKLAEVATFVQFEAPTDARLARWAQKHFAHHGVAASPAVCTELIAYAGNVMFVLANEIEKLAAFVKEQNRTEITSADIRTVAVPAALPDAFALSNALLAGDGKAALDALAVMKFERVPPTVVLGEIAQIFTNMQNVRVFLECGKSMQEISTTFKLHEYRVKLLAKALARTEQGRLTQLIDLVAKTDAALKNSSADYAPIEKLICSL